jgi:hypothetical protein
LCATRPMRKTLLRGGAMSADPKVLHQRLVQILAMEPNEPFTQESSRAAILGYCEGAVCARIPPVGGKPVQFQRYYEAIFGVELVSGKPLKLKEKRA